MTIESRTLFSIQAAILNGIRKEDSHLVTDAESSRAWDKLAAEIAQLRRDHPDKVIAVPNDIDSLLP